MSMVNILGRCSTSFCSRQLLNLPSGIEKVLRKGSYSSPLKKGRGVVLGSSSLWYDGFNQAAYFGRNKERVLLLPQSHSFSSLHSIDEDRSYRSKQSSPNERIRLNREEPLIDKVNKFLNAKIGTLHVDDITFTCVDLMIDCCMLNTTEGMKDAKDMLDRLLAEKRFVNEKNEGRDQLIIPAKVFEKYMYGWAMMARNNAIAIQKMEGIIDLMEKEDEYDRRIKDDSLTPHVSIDTSSPGTEKEVSCQPTVQTFNIILRGLREAAHRPNNEGAAFEAERCLDKMMYYRQTKGWHTKPISKSYTFAIQAFGNTHSRFAGDGADRLLHRCKNEHEIARSQYETDFGIPYNTMDPELNGIRIITPDKYVYSAAIIAHSNGNSPQSANRARDLLLELVERKNGAVATHVDNVLFTTTMNAFAQLAGNSKIAPAQRCHAANQAENLLWLMRDVAAQQEEMNAEQQGSSTIQDWDDDDDTELSKRESLILSNVAYNTCIKAWAKSDIEEAAPRAESLLQQMLEASMTDENAPKPDNITFNTVINAWARYSRYDPESPQKAEELMNLMNDLYHAGKLHEDAKPDHITYSSVINAWARGANSLGVEKVKNARRLLDEMLAKYKDGEVNMKPSIPTFTSVLNAAALVSPVSLSEQADNAVGTTDEDGFTSTVTEEENIPYSVALRTYDELWSDTYDLKLKPDHLTFATMLNVVRAHTDLQSAERRQLVQRIFDDACGAGHVSSLVIKAVRNACPAKDLLERLMGNRNHASFLRNINELNPKWTRNVGRDPAFRFVDREKRNTKDPGSRNVFIGNLPFGVEEGRVREIFQNCGVIKRLTLAKDQETGIFKGYGHIEFGDTQSVDEAIKLNGTDIMGRPLRVDYAQEKRRQREFGGRRGNKWRQRKLNN